MPRFPCLDLLKAGFEFALHALVCGAVIAFPRERIGQTLHVGQLVCRVVCVLVALAVVELFHQLGRRVAQREGNGLGKLRERVLARTVVCKIQRIGFRRKRQVNDRLGQVHRAFGHPDEMACLVSGNTDFERTRVGKPHVLAREAGDAPRNIQRVFARFQQTLQQKIAGAVQETLPQEVLSSQKLPSLAFALANIHFPKDMRSLEAARYRLKFEELFFLQLSLLRQKNVRMSGASGILFHKVGEAFNYCYNRLPYELTGAQKRVIKEIRRDTVSGKQMNRLLQGDVGSGKTMVALLTALIAVDNGYQACVMAPTEVLAVQHMRNFERNLAGSPVRVALLTGSTKAKERREIDAGLRDGSINILIGTHAVIEDNVVFSRLGFVVIDEQHRFGVDQRARLRLKASEPPHILVMTATPIPRTLAMTLYGDLDVSVIDELPPGRKPVQTIHVTEGQRFKMYDFIKSEIRKGRQAFIVYPLIKESEKLDYQNLEQGYNTVVDYFKAPEFVTAVVHGQQKNEDKAFDMKLFVDGKADILVATSVIEVGVDVPNASVMVIESAERFGLSQLHQLRGRVGRGAEKSYCLLMTGYKLSEDSRKRIELMCSTNDGFELAEADLRMRGPGDMEGTRQSGLAFDLRIADLGKDSPILNQARAAASDILADDPLLGKPSSALLRSGLDRLRQISGEIIDYSTIS